MSDLVQRLRAPAVRGILIAQEAADKIEALEAQRDVDGTTILLLEAERDRHLRTIEDATADYRRDREADTALLKQALEALTESQDLVWNEYTSDWRHGMPTRAGQLDAMHQTALAHDAAIAALRERLGEKS